MVEEGEQYLWVWLKGSRWESPWMSPHCYLQRGFCSTRDKFEEAVQKGGMEIMCGQEKRSLCNSDFGMVLFIIPLNMNGASFS